MSSKPTTATAPFLDKWVTQPVQYTQRDLLLYAQGIGCTELPFTYEHADEGFAAFPTFPIVLSFTGMDQDVVSFPSEVSAVLCDLMLQCVCSLAVNLSNITNVVFAPPPSTCLLPFPDYPSRLTVAFFFPLQFLTWFAFDY